MRPAPSMIRKANQRNAHGASADGASAKGPPAQESDAILSWSVSDAKSYELDASAVRGHAR